MGDLNNNAEGQEPGDEQQTTGEEQTHEEGAGSQENQGGENESQLWDGIAADHPIRAEVDKLRSESARRRIQAQEARTESDSLKQRLDGAKTQEEVDAIVADHQQKAAESEAKWLREHVARTHNVSDDFVEFLTASTEEELVKQAEKLANKKSAGQPFGAEPSGGRKPGKATPSREDDISAILGHRR